MPNLKRIVNKGDYFYFKDAPLHISGVSLDKHSITLSTVGQTEQLTATVTPEEAVDNPSVTWSSSDTSIATVSNTGLVTCVTPGECTITVTTNYGGFTDSCAIDNFIPIDQLFGYTGAEQSILLKPHTYCIEVWGASGGTQNNSGSRGGYSGGCITLNSASCLYIYVGGQGTWYNQGSGKQSSGGYNGGGGIYGDGCAATGGGGTDIRIGGNTLYHRRMVAGGGAGQGYQCSNGGAGGGITGVNGNPWNTEYACGLGGTQSAAGGYSGTTGGCCQCLNKGVGFGTGGMGVGWNVGGGGGGGGWYGGGGGNISGGGGGSGYVYNSSTCGNTPSGYCHCTDYFLTNAVTCCGAVSFPSPSGGTETGHIGDGCVRIRSI